MKKTHLKKPTGSELEILQVLWERGPSTVREVQENLRKSNSTVYTTTLKLLQRMNEKGIVHRDESNRSHVYAAAIQETQTQKRLLSDLVKNAFSNSTHKLVMRALSTAKASPEEIQEIRKLLDRMEEKE